MIVNIHAGHNPDGKIGCGAVGLIKESTEARKVKDLVIDKLRKAGHAVYDCTVDNGTSQNDILSKIVKKCNAHKVDLDVSIHFNSGSNDRAGNGSTCGTEVFVYKAGSKAEGKAKEVCEAISALGLKNRGVKYSTGLYVLRNTNSPAMLIECCFVDDKDDCKLYDAESVANAIVKGITGVSTITDIADTSCLQASDLKGLSGAEVIKRVGPLFTADQEKTGILASVSLAQFILESGYGKSELAQNANNCFGMKTSLSGNTWDSVWDGKSKYAKSTKEYVDNKTITIVADFRKYPSIEDSIADHSAYLSAAMNGNKKRYDGIVGCTDAEKVVDIIQDGGYATSTSYAYTVLELIKRLDLKQYNASSTEFKVKVNIEDLNIRKGPGTNYDKTGKYTGAGTFTITEVKAGSGSKKGWGKLKSGAGWISLDYCTTL